MECNLVIYYAIKRESEGADVPTVVSLDQNYPNPFNPSTTIRFGLTETSKVQLTVYNVLGQRVAILVQDNRPAGLHTITFDGSGLSSGTYLYRLQTDDVVNKLVHID